MGFNELNSVEHYIIHQLSGVKMEDYQKLQIIIPNLPEQNIAGEYCQKIEDNISHVESKISSSKALQKSLINQIF